MGLSVLEIGRLARTAPLEAEEGLLPCVSLQGNETLWDVGRFDDEYIPPKYVLWLIRLVGWLTDGKINLVPSEYIGIFTDRDAARAQVLDKTYYVLPRPLNRAWPRERIRIRGFEFPLRPLHRLLRRQPPPPEDRFLSVRESDLRTLLNEVRRAPGRG